ncbi:o-succinylbenzoate--CoA ligase [Pseudarthrobacter sulfonivorans]|uniref:O-succinylbenzoate--CoA ligase n=1 Tax=Pseudarthrobacter sulfonivorans TaxID=121292 RepID=A0A0U3PCB8_9MICC|nr:long-chain fatty acid--CoA ligase [Pseudarthrobacter sulfonivorans]ALV39880.1 o-succinylbenzoate--CoA ligase [Pseudarthrobacter sulfonivorans]
MDTGIGSWIAGRAFRDPDRIALVDGDTGRRRSYGELHERTNALADALTRLGVRRGDRIALLAMNSPEFLEVMLAGAKMGAITVPINFRLSADEVRYVLEDSGATVFVHSAQLAEVASAASRGLMLRFVLEIPSSVERAAQASSAYEEFLSTGSTETLERDVAEEDVTLIMYTSGTTGVPKGAMITHRNLLWQTLHMITLAKGLNSYDVTVTAAPLFHIGGLATHTLPLLYLGGTTVIVESFDPAQTVELMEREKVTVMFLVASMWTAVSLLPDLDTKDLSAVKYAISGGAPLPLPTLEFFDERGWVFTEGYGLTESTCASCFLAPEYVVSKAGSVGHPVTHQRMRLVDDTDRDVAVGEVGEILLQGPNIFAGYWGRPRETADAFRGGWFHTGDLARADSQGFLTLVDRKKDMVITGGENVYPIEVEQVLFRHPEVLEAAVIGLPDNKWGESVTAIVVRTPESTLTEEELIAWTRERLAHFKCPRRIEFVEELPRNATGKLLKRDLRRARTGSAESVSR